MYKINIYLYTDNTIQTTASKLKFTKSSFILKSTHPKDCVSNNLSEANHVSKISPDFLTTYIEEQHANETNNKKTIQKNLPKITGNHILPKGTIKIMKVSANDESLQNNLSKQVSCIDNTLESRNVLREKEYYMSEINRSVDKLKISESTLALNNNINLKNKNIDSKMHSVKIDRKNDFLMEINNIHNNVNANDAESGTTYEECILNKNISNLTDVSESCNINKSLIVSKEEVIKQNRKRIREENIIDIKLDNKKKRLNRINWQNNVTCTKALSPQQFNDSSNIDSMVIIESNRTEENNSKRQKLDLREHLNKRKLTQNLKLSASENKFNNKNCVKSEQVDLNNENNTTSTNTIKNEEFHKRLSFDKKPTLYKEKDIQIDPVCNNHMQCHSILQSTSKETQHINQIDKNIHEDNIQEKCTISRNEEDDDDNDDYISLFAESFDTTL